MGKINHLQTTQQEKERTQPTIAAKAAMSYSCLCFEEKNLGASGKRHYPTFCRLLYIAFIICCCTIQPSFGQTKPLHIYLLIGQSNMAGRGVVESEDLQTHPRVLMLDKNNEWTVAKDPMHFDKPVAGVGPGLSFGKMMAEADSTVSIGLVPCAAGGSSIDAWKVGGYHDQTKSYPYEEAIRRAKKAMQTGELKGFLWHQGESDSKLGQARQYARKLKVLINTFRKELHAPQVPFIVATLPLFYVEKNPPAAEVNQALQALSTRVKYTDCINTADLTHKGDTIHFDSASARELGKRYAKAIQQAHKNILAK
jgi:hypothetical protein